MKLTVISGTQVAGDLAETWARMQKADPALASPYFHPSFTRAVAAVRDDVFVTVIEDAGVPVAFFPFQRGPLGVGRPVAGPLSDYHGVIGDVGGDFSATELIRGSGLTSWTFDHCLASQRLFQPHHASAESPIMDLSEGYDAFAAGRRAAGSKQILKTEGLARKLEREIGPLRFAAHVSDRAALQQCISWKRAHYSAMGVNDILAPGWTRGLLDRIFNEQHAAFAGMLSTLHVGERLAAVHMGMRSATVWHYWFPTYDQELAKYSPGIILLLRMAASAPALGINTIDLGKGDTLYKDRLSNGVVAIAEGTVEVPGVATSFRRFRVSSEEWVRRSSFFGVARIPGRFIKRAEKWLRFR